MKIDYKVKMYNNWLPFRLNKDAAGCQQCIQMDGETSRPSDEHMRQ